MSIDGPGGVSVVARGLTVDYRRWRRRTGSPAVEEVSFDLVAGSITALRGANGSGKTTLLLALLGAVSPAAGSVEIGGLRPLRYRTTQGIGFLPAHSPAPRGWTGHALLAEGADLARLRGRSRTLALESAREHGPPLEHWHRPLETLSTGLLRRLLLAYALLGEPELILLDEPFAGLDSVSRRRVEETLGENASRGATVVLASHEKARTERRADRVIVLDGGRRVS